MRQLTGTTAANHQCASAPELLDAGHSYFAALTLEVTFRVAA